MKKVIYLLDTNIVSELTKPRPNTKVIHKLTELQHLCAISSTTWNELLFGIKIMSAGKRKDFLFSKLVNDIQAAFHIIPYDDHASWIHADLRAKLRETGKIKSFQDTQIASIAIANQMVLVTRNSVDFQPIQEVSSVFYLENWFE
ncbi:MAG: type II toxin-antitoxin system VapC family toxin [Spirochaetia bacterium]|nr:type II toxin-antitoxin system VapC family toxin [Spirochaetia bacterium]